MADFYVGQRVLYCWTAYGSENVESPATVTHGDPEWIGITIDRDVPGGWDIGGGRRCFTPDGSGGIDADCGPYARTNSSYFIKHQTITETTAMPLEYPPEPKIGYGVFTNQGREVMPGYNKTTMVGFGIVNQPKGFYSCVVETADNPTLQDYLQDAQRDWKQQCLALDFAKVENKLEFLAGLKLYYTCLYTDQFSAEIRFPVEIDPTQRRWSLTFDYSSDGLVTGGKTRDEVASYLSYNSPTTVAAVEDDKIIFDDGFFFHLTSRYTENKQPYLSTIDQVKVMLMQNLLMQRERRDSTPASEVAPATELAIAA